jgi:hypothetical protein
MELSKTELIILARGIEATPQMRSRKFNKVVLQKDEFIIGCS